MADWCRLTHGRDHVSVLLVVFEERVELSGDIHGDAVTVGPHSGSVKAR